ncbi:MAG: pantoate--beta-alanine ligase [Actinobacteria bacterium]|nr:pantoate--beta-alanine ligase [Actinomycetota bacterium]
MVQVIERVAELSSVLGEERSAGARVGLVPTMGALHAGHASLVERAASDCDVVCVSVFVNPLQFGSADDAAAYPRDLAADLVVAEKAGATMVFAPSVAEMYPQEPVVGVRVDGRLGTTLEGASRPGHFDGVTTIVAKLFNLVRPDRAFFGEKDYQQLLVVRRLVADLSFPVGVVGCPTVRALDGVAESSRNHLLSRQEREAAVVLNRALRAGAALLLAGGSVPRDAAELMADIIGAEPLVDLDYAVVVDADTLAVPEGVEGHLRLLVAARIGTTRLIDNLGLRVAA